MEPLSNPSFDSAQSSHARPRRTYLILTIVIILVGAAAAAAVYRYVPFNSALQQTGSNCRDPASISSHIYNPSRLQTVRSCITATGTVDRVLEEDDGDRHLWVSLDSTYGNLTNSANLYGELVVEIICVGQVTQPDAVSVCQNYSNNIPVPGPGEHIIVAGPYVLDMEHDGWAEIHPVYQLAITGPSIGATVHIQENIDINYASGSSYGLLGPTPRTVTTQATIEDGNQYTESLSLYSTSSSTEEITSIGISTDGFTIMNVNPSTPISFDPGATVTISLIIHARDAYFHGPLDVQIDAT